MGEEEAKDSGGDNAPAEGEQKLSKNQLKKLAKGKVSLAQLRSSERRRSKEHSNVNL